MNDTLAMVCIVAFVAMVALAVIKSDKKFRLRLKHRGIEVEAELEEDAKSTPQDQKANAR